MLVVKSGLEQEITMKTELRKVLDEAHCDECGILFWTGERAYCFKDTDGTLVWYCEDHRPHNKLTPTEIELVEELEEITGFVERNHNTVDASGYIDAARKLLEKVRYQ